MSRKTLGPSGRGEACSVAAVPTTVPELSIGFCRVASGRRVAYATAGAGPAIVMVPGWLSHVSELWGHPAAASALSKLSAEHRFVWYDRIGCGLSDRESPSLSLEDDVDQLVAVLDAAGIDTCDLVGYSFGGPAAALFATRHPERVRQLVLYSTYVRGADLAEQESFEALVGLVRSGWDMAAVVLAAIFLPDAPRADLRWFSRFQRRSTDSEVAADLLAYMRTHDVSEVLPMVEVPTAVVTTRGDRAVPPDRAHDVAGLVPRARLIMLDGRTHDPFIRDSGDVVEAILAAVEGRPFRQTEAVDDRRVTPTLTKRELDVLRCVARGSSNKAIAAELGVGLATVERHLTHVYQKLGASGRADAAVRAVTEGLFVSPAPPG